MSELQFTVPGEPVSKARARFTGYGSKVRSYTPAKTRTAEEVMARSFRAAGGTLESDSEVTFGVAVIFYNGTRQRRDVDNMLKLVLDGLNKVAWADDNQVVEVSGKKRYVDTREEARTEVSVYRLGRFERKRAKCQHCGEMYPTFKSWDARRKYCSADCRKSAVAAAKKRTCQQCGVEFQAHGPASTTRFCSKACLASFGKVEIPCSICGAPFMQLSSWADQGQTRCSDACKAEHARRTAAARRSKSFPGTCAICGAGTTRKEYRRCNPCKLAGKEVPA